MTKLTPKEEEFAQAYIAEKNNGSEAYRTAYSTENMKPETLWIEAYRVLNRPHVALRVFELQQLAAERNQLTVDDIIKEYEEARELAKEEKQASSMVAATSGKSKVLGFDKMDVNLRGDITYNISTGIDAAPNNKS